MSHTIMMIGTGNAFANDYYNNNAIIDASGFLLLIDFGVTGPRALEQLGIPYSSLNAVLVSHTHSDHIGGLEELAVQYMTVSGKKLTLYIPETLRGPLWERILQEGLTHEPRPSLDDYFTIIPMPIGQPTDITPELVVEPIRTEHIKGRLSYSFVINERFFYSADMRFNRELIVNLVKHRGIKHIFHDCQLSCPGAVHACLDELLTLPQSIQSMTKLMHYEDTMPQYAGKTGLMTFAQQGTVYTI